jgi:uncharacterized membrane protein YqgA involved in biofilm formation
LIGTLVNAGAIIAGTAIGLAAKRRIPAKAGTIAVKVIGLVTLFIGLQMAVETRNPLIVAASIILGVLIGETLSIEDRLENLSRRLENRFDSAGGGITRTFITASLLFCVGPMAIMGSIEDGLGRMPEILYTKSVMDGVGSALFASTLGIGVIFSALPVLVYQGSLTLAAQAVFGYLSPPVVAQLTATGGLIIMAIGLNLTGATKIRVANLIPALIAAVAIALALQK